MDDLPPPEAGDLYFLALPKGEERYIVMYESAKKDEALRTLGRWAANPELSFSWYDAARLSFKIREQAQETIQ